MGWTEGEGDGLTSESPAAPAALGGPPRPCGGSSSCWCTRKYRSKSLPEWAGSVSPARRLTQVKRHSAPADLAELRLDVRGSAWHLHTTARPPMAGPSRRAHSRRLPRADSYAGHGSGGSGCGLRRKEPLAREVPPCETRERQRRPPVRAYGTNPCVGCSDTVTDADDRVLVTAEQN